MFERLKAMANDDLGNMMGTVESGEPVAIPHFSNECRSPCFEGKGGLPGSYWQVQAAMLLAVSEATTVFYQVETDDE